MKIKSTLVVLALGASFGAMAHHTAFNTPYNANEEINRPMAGHANVAITAGTVAVMDETSGATFDGAEGTTLQFRYDGDKKIFPGFQTPAGRNLERAVIHVCVGPKPENATKNTLTLRLRVTSKKDSKGQDKQLPMDFAFETIELTDEVQHLVLVSEEKSGEYFENGFKDAVTGKELKVRYYDLFADDAEAGQFVALEGMGFDRYEMPTITFDREATWEAAMTAHSYDGVNKIKVEEPGTLFIQAEDITPSWILGRVGHNGIHGLAGRDQVADGYACRRNVDSFWYEPDFADVQIHNSESFNGGMALWQAYGEGHISKHANVQDFALLGMCQLDGEFGTNYNGEYIDETSNKITKEAADKGFGSFAEYAFDMAEDGYLDISVLAGPHRLGWYDAVNAQGYGDNPFVTKHGKERSEGGYEVEGVEGDYLQQYGFSYIVYLDDVPLRTAWDIRPTVNTRTGALLETVAKNPLRWTNCQEEVDGEMVNSYHLWMFPNFFAGEPAGATWWGIYKDHFINRAYNEQVKTGTEVGEDGLEHDVFGDSNFKKALAESDKTLEDFLHPDYMDIPCSAGRHVIKVQSCGGATVFDELKLRGKSTPSKGQDGVSNVVADRSEAAEVADAPAEYFDLQGRKVANPTNGIFIVKRGNKVTKQVIR